MTRSEAIGYLLGEYVVVHEGNEYEKELNEALDMAIKALQGDMYCPNCGVRLVQEDEYLEPTQTHGRPIDADALKSVMEKRKQFFVDAYGGSFHCMSEKDKARCDEIDACIASIVNAPTVQADRPHGEWIFRTDIPIGGGRESAGYVCSNCRKDYFHVDGMNFCPNCECVMDMRKETE